MKYFYLQNVFTLTFESVLLCRNSTSRTIRPSTGRLRGTTWQRVTCTHPTARCSPLPTVSALHTGCHGDRHRCCAKQKMLTGFFLGHVKRPIHIINHCRHDIGSFPNCGVTVFVFHRSGVERVRSPSQQHAERKGRRRAVPTHPGRRQLHQVHQHRTGNDAHGPNSL